MSLEQTFYSLDDLFNMEASKLEHNIYKMITSVNSDN